MEQYLDGILNLSGWYKRRHSIHLSRLQDVLDIRNTINVPISVMGVPAEESPSLGEAAAFPLALRVSQELSAHTLPL